MNEEAYGTAMGISQGPFPRLFRGHCCQLGPMCSQGQTHAPGSWSSSDALPAHSPNSLLQGARGTWRPRDGGENVVRVNQAHQVLEQTLRGDQQQGWMNPAPTKKGAISPR